MLAVECGRSKECVDLLIKAGAPLNYRDLDGLTALMLAIKRDRFDLVHLLLQAGSDLALRDRDGRTPFILAVQCKSNYPLGYIQTLINAGAKIDDKNSKNGRTPLMVAVEYGRIDRIKFLIEAGSNVNMQDNNGETPLMIAANDWFATIDIVQTLIDAGVNLNFQNNKNQTAYDLALDNGNQEIAEYLKVYYEKQRLSKTFIENLPENHQVSDLAL